MSTTINIDVVSTIARGESLGKLNQFLYVDCAEETAALKTYRDLRTWLDYNMQRVAWRLTVSNIRDKLMSEPIPNYPTLALQDVIEARNDVSRIAAGMIAIAQCCFCFDRMPIKDKNYWNAICVMAKAIRELKAFPMDLFTSHIQTVKDRGSVMEKREFTVIYRELEAIRSATLANLTSAASAILDIHDQIQVDKHFTNSEIAVLLQSRLATLAAEPGFDPQIIDACAVAYTDPLSKHESSNKNPLTQLMIAHCWAEDDDDYDLLIRENEGDFERLAAMADESDNEDDDCHRYDMDDDCNCTTCITIRGHRA